ncbi:hypothetical protein [Marinibactrum halimedae]|uniref:Uncharacterized protein n=1 Tax=Marinibactrum halimedae TaxID=1444977 RepID=A0AA37T5S3_9GAMM|nr:hypothetical protein [Marinibactrum halimedae]MCD9458793.1 hypothetical protein [Marinibactrum halimedae]GLS25352.1 hypothetical protein GCM10007877_10660 [Marinibactrum halimedae]
MNEPFSYSAEDMYWHDLKKMPLNIVDLSGNLLCYIGRADSNPGYKVNSNRAIDIYDDDNFFLSHYGRDHKGYRHGMVGLPSVSWNCYVPEDEKTTARVGVFDLSPTLIKLNDEELHNVDTDELIYQRFLDDLSKSSRMSNVFVPELQFKKIKINGREWTSFNRYNRGASFMYFLVTPITNQHVLRFTMDLGFSGFWDNNEDVPKDILDKVLEGIREFISYVRITRDPSTLERKPGYYIRDENEELVDYEEVVKKLEEEKAAKMKKLQDSNFGGWGSVSDDDSTPGW